MKNKQNNNKEGIAKGYRLKPETHELVENLSKKIGGTKDEVISRACKMLRNSVDRAQKNRNNNKY